MCTVSYIPHPDGFVLSSNRDERKDRRKAHVPGFHRWNDYPVCAPIDPEGNGTWLAASESGRVLCLLNGGRKSQNFPTNGTQSRGLLLKNFWQTADPVSFYASVPFSDFQPFTLILAEPQSLMVISWDGLEPALEILDPGKPAIWSSTTIYLPAIQRRRETWFENWHLQYPSPKWEDVWNFHSHTQKQDKENGLLIRRADGKETVSITSVWVDSQQIQMRYLDLASQRNEPLSILSFPIVLQNQSPLEL